MHTEEAATGRKSPGRKRISGRTRVNMWLDNALLEALDAEYPEIGNRTDRVAFVLKRHVANRRRRKDGDE